MRWRPGEQVLLRQLFRGRLWGAVAAIVAEDSPKRVALWLPPGAENASAEGDLFDGWTLRRGVARGSGVVRLTEPGADYSILLFRHEDGTFRGWYVNFEEPLKRTHLGFDFEDHLLDLWIEPDGSRRWLDEDEFDEAVRLGFFTADDAAKKKAEGERVLEEWPFPTGWEDWRPDPRWETPRLPAGWDVLES